MKNLAASILAVLAIVLVLLGCSAFDETDKAGGGSNGANVNANKSITERAMETAVGEELVGIPACDEAIELLAAQANNPDDSVITQALKKTALNRFRAEVKQRLVEQKADRANTEKYCTDFASTLRTAANANTKPSP